MGNQEYQVTRRTIRFKPQSYVAIMMSITSLNFSFLMGLMVKLAMSKELDLGEVLDQDGVGRPLFEDVAYDSSLAFEIFLDEDESFNIADRNEDGPKAPKFNISKTAGGSDDKDGENLNPDLSSHSSVSSTQITVFVVFIAY